MCLICVDFQRQRMTVFEARRAFGEMIVAMDPEHAKEVQEMLDKAEREQEEQRAAGASSASASVAAVDAASSSAGVVNT